ncbi:helix-turn-helix domain-containing protein [Salarchaeum sp. JOR-1]|uniref:ArsR/SmtB family transcription factor n=1 Tax=Salarchaeum sp. JOR-1 TaxID=2599399 RepID=UPI00143D240E|nr:helix-turn-helix domain-containing protein [Salarchaeum sp. JOR-1]
MKRLLSFQSTSRPEPGDGTAIVDIDDQGAGDIFEALAADTTRQVLTTIYNQSGTASEVADEVDTSLQNAKYHLDKLQEANLIEVADTWYSEQGNEMKVYAPTNESIVVLAGEENTKSSLRETLTRLIGAVGVLAVGSSIVERLVQAQANPYQVDQAPSSAWWMPFSTDGFCMSPGLLFFTGGLIVLVLVCVWSLLDSRN